MAEPALTSPQEFEFELDPAETGVHPVVIVDAPTGRDAVRASLVCVSGDDLGRSVRLDGKSLEIGRAQSGLSLTSADVSRRHARIHREPDGYVLEDLDSANGTYLNGERVTGPARLRIGDRVQVGRTVLVFSHHDELEERMERLQRLEAMGTMAGGIAHDFNNALAVIVGNLDLVAEALPADAELGLEALDAIRKATSSATNLAKRLLRLGSKDPLTIGIVSLAPLIDQTMMMARRRSTAKLTVELDVEPDLHVLGSFDELQQVLINLYYNSCDAMPSGGKLCVSARAIELDRRAAVEHQLEVGGHYVLLTVRDTGCGMDATTRARLFEPFFTTKGRGKGTGLGLAMIHGAVRRHGGAIEVESAPGMGATFRIYLHRRV
ncbi:MAG: FHA domain-containing protein [Myxococcales bacterium]|nr:FHA domain-containing protein [Myxococcales bacterium]